MIASSRQDAADADGGRARETSRVSVACDDVSAAEGRVHRCFSAAAWKGPSMSTLYRRLG